MTKWRFLHRARQNQGRRDLDKAFATAGWDEAGLDFPEKGRKQIREAVELERTRLWDSQPPGKEAETDLGREIQKQTGAASVVVNRIIQEAAKRRLKSREAKEEERIEGSPVKARARSRKARRVVLAGFPVIVCRAA
jgi:hypothetical protein